MQQYGYRETIGSCGAERSFGIDCVYADWSPHYEWIGPVLRTYERRVIELINVNIEENKTVADSHNIDTVPAFLLLHKGHELWRQVGELTIGELKEVLEDFK